MPNKDYKNDLSVTYRGQMVMDSSLKIVTIDSIPIVDTLDGFIFSGGVTIVAVMGGENSGGSGTLDSGYTYVEIKESDTFDGTYTAVSSENIIGSQDTSDVTLFSYDTETLIRTWGVIGSKKFLSITLQNNSGSVGAYYINLYTYKKSQILPNF